MDLTENKRRVITLLKKAGPLAKGELATRGEMGWATAVKVIRQLHKAGIVERLGTVREEPPRRGKRAYLYGLTMNVPLAVGVDVEYRTTSMVLTNLAGDVLASQTFPTVKPTSDAAIRGFLRRTVGGFLRRFRGLGPPAGIGIGIPGIGFPSNNRLDNLVTMRELGVWLARKMELEVRVSDNTKNYAVFEQWSNQTFPFEDFIFLSVRTGVGTGIFHGGNLYMGTHGLAGEIGHMPLVTDGRLCRCGNRGCMETIVGQRYLYREYRRRVISRPVETDEIDPAEIQAGLADLFSRAATGDARATEVVGEAATALGRCLASAILVLDITSVVVSGHFGPDGSALLPPLRAAIQANLLPGTEFSVKYLPFDPQGHVQGAALLILKDYFIDLRAD